MELITSAEQIITALPGRYPHAFKGKHYDAIRAELMAYNSHYRRIYWQRYNDSPSVLPYAMTPEEIIVNERVQVPLAHDWTQLRIACQYAGMQQLISDIVALSEGQSITCELDDRVVAKIRNYLRNHAVRGITIRKEKDNVYVFTRTAGRVAKIDIIREAVAQTIREGFCDLDANAMGSIGYVRVRVSELAKQYAENYRVKIENRGSVIRLTREHIDTIYKDWVQLRREIDTVMDGYYCTVEQQRDFINRLNDLCTRRRGAKETGKATTETLI